MRRVFFRSLVHDSGLTSKQRLRVKLQLSALPRYSSLTQQNTRCRVSGRARQVSRDVQLARMSFRQLSREGRLLAYRLGRF